MAKHKILELCRILKIKRGEPFEVCGFGPLGVRFLYRFGAYGIEFNTPDGPEYGWRELRIYCNNPYNSNDLIEGLIYGRYYIRRRKRKK